MTTINLPKTTVNKLPAQLTVDNEEQKVLFVGQMTSGTATAGNLVTSIGVAGEEDALFGANSMIAGMVRNARKVNEQTRFDAIPLADAAGTPAAGVVAFSGTAGADGEFVVTVGSREDHSYTIAVTDLDTNTVIGDALEAAINADTNAPFTAANVTGTVTITMDNDGTEGNAAGIEVTGSAASVSFTITAFTGGATNPTLTNVFDVVGDVRYQTVIFPNGYGFDFVTDDFLDGRFNVNNSIEQGVAVTSATGTKTVLAATLASENSQSLVVHCNKAVSVSDEYEGSALFELDYAIASQIGAIRALRLTSGSNLSGIISAGDNFLDFEGGPHMASFPYFNTDLNSLPVIDEAREWTAAETNDLNDAGGSVVGNNRPRNGIIFGEMFTTYKTNTAGNPDRTWEKLNAVDTMSGATEYVFNNLRSDFAQARLTDGDLVQGHAFVNVPRFKAAMMGYYDALSGQNLVLLRAGEDNRKFFSDNLTPVLSLIDGKITSGAKFPIVVQLRELLVQAQTVFDIT